MQKNGYHWILSDVNIIRYRKTKTSEFCLMLISSDEEKQLSWLFSDVNIIRCRKTDIIEFCLMLISSHVEKQTTLNFVWGSYHIIQKNSYHWTLSDANIIGCRKTASIEFYLMLTSSDVDKNTSEVGQMFVSCAKKQVLLNFVWC